MLEAKNKYTINVKTNQQTYTVKSTLEPDLSQVDLSKVSIVWYRQPPPPYEIEQLGFNFNKKTYKCNSLDYECSIICKVINQQNKETNRFDFGPIQTFLYNRLSANLQLRVQVLLFNNLKKCVFSFNSTPTLINPNNNNKYQLTQQDIRSIYLKQQNSVQQINEETAQELDQISILKNKKKKTIIVQNLFQRLILLKLFHQIPNGMYCYSMELLQIYFYDQSSCNMALFALNRIKYQKREVPQIAKSMFNHTSQDLLKPKFMKKSNDSLTQFSKNSDTQNPVLSKHLSVDLPKKQIPPFPGLNLFKKSPKQSINSAGSESMSGNSGKVNQNKSSFIIKKFDSKDNLQVESREYPSLSGNLQFNSKISIKQPKISILSTEINSIKGPRQLKPSFPQTPTQIHSHNLKTSQFLGKPKDFKAILSLRRSQQEIKTPRMDAEDQQKNLPGPIKKKSISGIQQPFTLEHPQQQTKYVNQFQSLLFEGDQQKDESQLLCLNDSFIKMEEQEDDSSPFVLKINANKNYDEIDQNLLRTISPSSPTKSQRNLISLKERLLNVMQQNNDLKQKNQDLRREIEETKCTTDKKTQLSKFQEQIDKMKQVQENLINQIQKLKRSSIGIPHTQKHRHQGNMNLQLKHQIREKNVQNLIVQNHNIQMGKWTGISSPARQSKNANDINQKNTSKPAILVCPGSPVSPGLGGRRSQQNEPKSYFINRQAPTVNIPNNGSNFNSQQARFMRFNQDSDYYKFRNNQSYSYKVNQNNKNDQFKSNKQPSGKQSFFKF